MATGKELARTRVMPGPRPEVLQTRVIQRRPEAGPPARVYVSKRAVPFHERHRIALLLTGAAMMLASGVAIIVMAVGWVWFAVSVASAALFVTILARITRGGSSPRGQIIEVTTTARVRIR